MKYGTGFGRAGVVLLCLIGLALCAPPAQSQTLIYAEYYIDADPGTGHATPILPCDGTFDEPDEDFCFDVTTTSELCSGRHKFLLRILDSDSIWCSRQLFFTVLSPIAYAEVFWEPDPGIGNGIPISPVDGGFGDLDEDFSYEAQSPDLPDSIYDFTLRVRDECDDWSQRRYRALVSSSDPVGLNWLAAARIRMDGGAWQTLSSADGFVNEPTELLQKTLVCDTAFTNRFHFAEVQVQDRFNTWSTVRSHEFVVEESNTSKKIKGGEIFVDSDPGEGNGIPLLPIDSAFDSSIELGTRVSLPSSSLTVGRHHAFVRFKDNYDDSLFNGWGESSETSFTVTDGIVNPLPDLIVKSISVNPEVPFAGQTAHVAVIVSNEGDTTAGAFTVGLRESQLGPVIDEIIVAELLPGQEAVAEFSWTAVCGQNPIFIDVDASGEVEESDETNNERTLHVSTVCSDQIQVVFDSPQIAIGLGDTAFVSATVFNLTPTPLSLSTSMSQLEAVEVQLELDSLWLPAHGYRKIEMTLISPGECSVVVSEQTTVLSVRSVDPPVEVSGSAELRISALPEISDLYPLNGQAIASDSLSFIWRSSSVCNSQISIRKEGEQNFQTMSGSTGTEHEIRVGNLVQEARYFWFATDSTECGVVKSDLRSFVVTSGVVFSESPYNFQVERDYNQERFVTITNRDSHGHTVRVNAITSTSDLIFGFVGSGGSEESVILATGASVQVPFMIHAQDAQGEHYSLQFRLEAERSGQAPIVDYATATVHVRTPNVAFHFEEAGLDSVTLIRKMKIINDGELVSDLSVRIKKAGSIDMLLFPQVEHYLFKPGEAIEFQAIPAFNLMPSRAEGDVVIEATGSGHSTETLAEIPCDKVLIAGSVNNVLVTSGEILSWYCTNRKNITMWILVRYPCGSNVPSAVYLKDEFWPKAIPSPVRPHNLDHVFNAEDVEPALINAVPNGEYVFHLDGPMMTCSSSGVSTNTVQIRTEHLNGGHYVVNTGVELAYCDSVYTEVVCASSQEQADSIVASRPYVKPLATGLHVQFLEPLANDLLLPSSHTTLRVKVFDDDSLPVSFAQVRVTPGGGAEIALGHRGDGIYEGTWDVSPAIGDTTLIASAELCGETVNDSIQITMGFIRLIAPLDADTIQERPQFIWSSLPCDRYFIEFGSDDQVGDEPDPVRPNGSFTAPFGQYYFTQDDTTWNPQEGFFTHPGTYYWHVSASLNNQFVPFSEIRSFTVADVGQAEVELSTLYDCVYYTVTDAAGSPIRGAEMSIFRDGSYVRAPLTDINGNGKECELETGDYTYEVSRVDGGRQIIARGDFQIDSENKPPWVSAVLIQPVVVPNDGSASISITAYAVDPEDELDEVFVDLSSLDGESRQLLNHESDSTYTHVHPITENVVSGAVNVRVCAIDKLLAKGSGSGAIMVGSGVTETRTIGMFTVTAERFEQYGANQVSAAGNVHISDNQLNTLDINPQGALLLDMEKLNITASGNASVSVNLGSYGRYQLFEGQFNLDARSGLMSPSEGANILLDEVAGFFVDPSQLVLDIQFGEGGGIDGTGNVILDEIDGVPDNDLPFTDFKFHLGFDGKVSGSLESDSLAFDVSGTHFFVRSVNWADTVLIARGVRLLPPDFISNLSAGSIEVDSLVISPSGVQVENIRFEEWSFNAGGFEVVVDSGRILDNGLQLTGSINLTHNFGYAKVEKMLLTDQGITIEGGGFELPDLQVGQYKIGGVHGEFMIVGGAFYIEGRGNLGIPNFANVGIRFKLDSSCEYLLKEFCLAVKDIGPGIPIGSTGLFLTAIGGCITEESPPGLCGSNWVIFADVSVATSTFPILDKKAIQGDVQLRITWGALHGTGTLYLVGYGLGNGYFDLDASSFHGHGEIAVPPSPGEWLQASADIWLKSRPQLSIYGSTVGSLTVPGDQISQYVWFWHDDIRVSNFNGGFDGRGIYGQFNVANILSLAIELFWNGQVSLGGNLEGRGEKSASVSRRIPRFQRSAMADSIETAVLPHDHTMVFGIRRSMPDVTLGLVSPNGTLIDSATLDPNVTFRSSSSGEFYVVKSPLVGKWIAVVDNAATDTSYAYQAFSVNSSPLVTLTAPGYQEVSSGDSVQISWLLTDQDGDDVAITLLYATDSTMASPIAIVDSLGANESYWWHPIDVPGGQYRILAVADDHHSTPQTAISPGSVKVVNLLPPARPTLELPVNGNREIRLEWEPATDMDLMGYIVYWAQKDSLEWHRVDVGYCFGYTISNLSNGTFYKFALQAYDLDSNLSEVSVPVYGIPRAYADATPPAAPSFSVQTNQLPVSVSFVWPAVVGAAGYGIYYDTDSRLPLNGKGLTQGSSPIHVALDTTITLTGLRNGATYFFLMRAHDALGNKSPLTPPTNVVVCCTVDEDGDGLDDDWEVEYFGSTSFVSEMYGDHDGDGSANIEELTAGTDPTDCDTDDDSIWDGDDAHPLSALDSDNDLIPDDWESYWTKYDSTCAIDSADSDDDWLSNRREYLYGTKPTDEDTDDDSFLDGIEVNLGSDPLDSSSIPILPHGDADGNGLVGITDAVYMINYVFMGGPAPANSAFADVDCSGRFDLSDVVYLISYLYADGPKPCDPNNDGKDDCGSDLGEAQRSGNQNMRSTDK